MNHPEVLVYRCQTCGRWSHAQRKPKHHKKFVVEPADDDFILEELTGHESDTGAPVSAFYVACGPFDTYRAERVA